MDNRALRYCLLSLLWLFIFSHCRPVKVYQSRQFENVTAAHQTLAILPCEVILASRYQAKSRTYAQIRQQLIDEGLEVQKTMGDYFAKDSARYNVHFQSIHQTNHLLTTAGISYHQVRRYPRQELATLLGVDALVFTTVTRTSLVGVTDAIAAGAAFGLAGIATSRNVPKAKLEIQLFDPNQPQAVWKLTDKSVDLLDVKKVAKMPVRKALSKFPYRKDS